MYRIVKIVISCLSFFILNSSLLWSQEGNQVTISNGRQAITLERYIDPADTNKGGFRLKEIKNLKTGYAFDTSLSPIFQVTINQAYPSDNLFMQPSLATQVPSNPELLSTGYYLTDLNKLKWGEISDNSVEMKWVGLETGSGQTLDVSVIINFETFAVDGKAKWDIKAILNGEGDLVIRDIKFPFLVFPKIGENQEDDILTLPLIGGALYRNPISIGNNLPDMNGDITHDAFLYPGEMQEQFITYYDGSDGNGFYLASEDTNGYTKKIYFNKGNDSYLKLYMTHYNSASPGQEKSGIISDFQSFSLSERYGYYMVTDLFAGDWMDAATIYRNWAINSSPVFLSKGKIKDRNDLSAKVKESSFIFYLFDFNSGNPNFQVTYDHEDPDSDFSRIKEMIDFMREREEIPIVVYLHPVTSAKGLDSDPEKATLGSDWGDVTVNANIPELIANLQERLGVVVAFNRDTGNWFIRHGAEGESKFTELNAINRGIVLQEDFMPWIRSTGETGDLTGVATCNGSQWIIDLRNNFLDQTFNQTKITSNSVGINGVMISGQGSVSKIDYAPASPSVAKGDHSHSIGGGNFPIVEWRNFSNRLISKYKTEINPDFFLLAERGHEHLIGINILFDVGDPFPRQDFTLGHAGGVSGFEPVPMTSFIYHDYAVMTGGMNDHKFSVYHNFYNSSDYPMQFNHDLVMNTILYGKAIGQLVIQGDTVTEGSAIPLLKSLNGTPAELSPIAIIGAEYTRLLSGFRYINRNYLIYGQAVRPPTLITDTIPVEFSVGGVLKSYTIPRIISGAWKAEDNSIGLAFANFNETSTDMSFKFRPADYGLKSSSTYEVYQVVDGQETLYDTFEGNISEYSSKGSILFNSAPNAASIRLFKIKEKDAQFSSNYTNRGSNGLCFIAGAVYGSQDAKEVLILREFRDRYLLTNSLGRGFITLYYLISPPIAGYVMEHEYLRSAMRYIFYPVVLSVDNIFLKYDVIFSMIISLLLSGIIITIVLGIQKISKRS